MARTAEGFRIRRDPRTSTYFVRFTAAGRPYNLSTRETDPRRAEKVAAQLYADGIAGRLVPRGPKVESASPTPVPPTEFHCSPFAPGSQIPM
jgi:hypothetical protein